MKDRIPRTQSDHVLVGVKAKPSGWPTANLDPDSGRGPQATSGTPANENHQFRVSTVSGDCRRSVGPPWAQGMRWWWISHQAKGRVQPATAQVSWIRE